MSAFRHATREIDRSTLVDHTVDHPNGSRAHCDWAQQQTLHVAVMYSNPYRFATRLKLFNDCIRHMQSMPNIRLYIGEVAYGDRPFEVTSHNYPDNVQLRTRDTLWHKENALNQVIERFHPSWEYGAYVDGDFNFNRHDIGLETIHQLQHHQWVQMFSEYTDLGPDHQVLRTSPGFAYAYDKGLDVHGKKLGSYGHPGAPGGAWAFRRESFNSCGRLIDFCILGSADHHMAIGLVGSNREHPDTHKCGDAYAEAIKTWQERAYRVVRGNIGFVKAHVCHHYHGPRKSRGYEWRWKILRDSKFDPHRDLFRDDQGLFRLTDLKPKLRDEIHHYFRFRNEDDISL